MKVTDYPALTTPHLNDLLLSVDESDTTGSPQGTSKKVTLENLLALSGDAIKLTSAYSSADILKDYGNGNVTLGAAGGALLVGYNECTELRFLTGSGTGIGATRMTLKDTGRLGIGTDAPTTPLHVKNTGDAIVMITSGNSSLAQLSLGRTASEYRAAVRYDNAADDMHFLVASATRMTIDNLGRVGIGTQSPGETLDIDGSFRLQGSAGNIEMNDTGAWLKFTRDSASYIAATDAAGQLDFGTGGNNSQMRIAADGKVGIGTASPTRDLIIVHSKAGADVITEIKNADNTNTSSNAKLGITSGGSSAGDPCLVMTVSSVQDWCIGVDNSDSDKLKIGHSYLPHIAPDITITTGGSVGIGNTSPGAKLAVSTTQAAVVDLNTSASEGQLSLQISGTDKWGAIWKEAEFYIYDWDASAKRFIAKDNGVISMPGLPTSASGLSSGDLWNDSGSVKIV